MRWRAGCSLMDDTMPRPIMAYPEANAHSSSSLLQRWHEHKLGPYVAAAVVFLLGLMLRCPKSFVPLTICYPSMPFISRRCTNRSSRHISLHLAFF